MNLSSSAPTPTPAGVPVSTPRCDNLRLLVVFPFLFLDNIFIHSFIQVAGTITRQDTGKLYQDTCHFIRKRQCMTISTPADGIELAKLSKLINERTRAITRKYIMERIHHVVKKGGSLKATKRVLVYG